MHELKLQTLFKKIIMSIKIYIINKLIKLPVFFCAQLNIFSKFLSKSTNFYFKIILSSSVFAIIS
jgi:hypothetical protein